jgi:hypothetical protein
MAIDLTEQVFAIERTLTGSDSFVVETGNNLVIKNGDTDIFKDKPTSGKQWQVVITLKIEESSK